MAKYVEIIKEYDCYHMTNQIKTAILSGSFSHSRVIVRGTDIMIVTNNGLLDIDVGQWLVLDPYGNAKVLSNEEFTQTYQLK